MSVLLINIKNLCGIHGAQTEKIAGTEMKNFPSMENAFLFMNNGIIESFGLMSALKRESLNFNEEINCTGKFVLPTFCDSHTHVVYAGSREGEYVDRINGLSYEEIALRGGGILNSAKKLNATKEEELYSAALARINECIIQGTGAIEIKSGYGLSLEGELKMLRIIKKLKENLLIPVKATFLGAHAFPLEYKSNPDKYVDVIINDMMPVIEQEKLADYCDVFCERNYFTPAQTIRILEAGKKHGMKPKVHANQLSLSGGVQAGVQAGAASVDHLEYVEEAEIISLQHAETMPTILPGAQIFLQLPPPPARKMIDAGLPLAIASDYNPGSSPSGNMSLMVALSCMLYKLTPEEAFNATTINTAYAMDLQKTHGSIAKGKIANVMVTKEIPSIAYMPYSFGSNLIEQVFINGKRFNG